MFLIRFATPLRGTEDVSLNGTNRLAPTPSHLHLVPFKGGFFERAKAQGLKLSESDKFKINIRESPQRSEYVGERLPELNKVVKGAGTHRTSPFVFSGCGENDKVYVGGATEFIAHVKEAHPEMG